MSTELESYYKDYIFKTHIAYTDEKCIERGVFATEDIKIGDILLKLPMTEVMKGTHVELTYALMKLDSVNLSKEALLLTFLNCSTRL